MVPPLTLCAYMKKGPNLRWSLIQCSGGDEGNRTPDLLTASQALSQLSYAPVRRSTIRELGRRCKDNFGKIFRRRGRGCGTGSRASGPRCPIRPAGRAPRAAALPPPSSPAPLGHLESRRPPLFASAALAAIRSKAVPPAPGPLSGPTAPLPGDSKTMPDYGAGAGTTEHAGISGNKTAGRRLVHFVKCRSWTAGPCSAP